MNYFEVVNGNKDNINLSVISSLKYKEFILSGLDDNQGETYIILRKEEIHPMIYDENRKSFIFGLDVSDYNFYKNIVRDPILIKQGNKDIQFKFIQ
ncbi:hypothetical protein DRF67_05505 [Chryseobacterium pennipullorum]|uniref:Uncharacterized protein n=2 Tax=Chryseobacterium pennipullorum TaxID=2258963 RepID=A0A3D9B5V2_9FLAO|nr:hypothetical protein DRF67_05505 [Chryseobacterium pennipullorum]